MRRALALFLLSSFLFGCSSASSSPETASHPKETPTLMPSTTQPSSTWWQPKPGLTWQWQIGNDDIDTSIEADVYDIDLYVD